ncbi:hypothetical protein EP7_001185 [Isosphaeraceae bacterium EP7]
MMYAPRLLLRFSPIALCALVGSLSGCNQQDGTVRGSGSIDIPKSSFRSYAPGATVPLAPAAGRKSSRVK